MVVKKKTAGVPNEITFKYIFEKGYHPDYVSGAVGGATPRGDIVLNFYFERNPLPDKQTYKVSSDGTIDGSQPPDSFEPRDLDKSIVRQIQSGVIIDTETAEDIITFLQKHIAAVNERTTIAEEGEE